MAKTDLTKTYKSYYTAKARAELVNVEPAHFLSIRGKGDPSSAGYASTLQVLYAVAYAVKFACKARGCDFTVAKLEGLWWFDRERFGNPSADQAPRLVPRSEWEYRMLIRMPDDVTKKDLKEAQQLVLLKKKAEGAERVEWFDMKEGACVQILHVGPFDTEPESIQKMVMFMEAEGLKQNGYHHEIYLSDFRKTPPEKLKTILREPVK